MLDAALRQLRQFGYDLDRMEFVARDEAELLAQVRQDYDRLTAEVTRVVSLIRTGQTDEARTTQLAQIMPLADRLERLTNQLVNIAEADMVDAIETTERAYATSRADRDLVCRRQYSVGARPWIHHLMVADRAGQGD